MIKFLLFLIACIFSFALDAQKELEEVRIVGAKNKLDSLTSVSQKMDEVEIQRIGSIDAGELVSRFAGVSLRSYGSVGSLKTIAVRGFGSQHTTVLVNGFVSRNFASGAIDLSGIRTVGLTSASLQNGSFETILLPVSAFLSASNLSFQQYFYKLSAKNNQIHTNLTLGSFGLIDQFISVSGSINPNFSWFASYNDTKSQGDYSYSYLNYKTKVEAIRTNNDFASKNGQIGFRLKLKKHQFFVNSLATKSKQGLPGALVLYAPTSPDRLDKRNFTFQISDDWLLKRWKNRSYSSFLNDHILFQTSNVLSNKPLFSLYNSQQFELGNTSTIKINEKMGLWVGTEIMFQKMTSNKYQNTPNRTINNSVIGMTFETARFKAIAHSIMQSWSEKRIETQSQKMKPVYFGSISTLISKKREFWATLHGKSSFRLPSFNEMYFQDIGNLNLKPEEGNELNLQLRFGKSSNLGLGYSFVNDIFLNQIKNKIIALPTKNLFQWSTMNIGNTQGFGSETKLNLMYNLRDWNYSIDANYSFQSIVDVTDKLSATYQNQLPYQAKHTFNSNLIIAYKSQGIQLTNSFLGKRYSLNQNIKANKIDAFSILDFTCWKSYKLPAGTLKILFSIKNCTNESYAFLKNYYLPNRNYLLTINYALP